MNDTLLLRDRIQQFQAHYSRCIDTDALNQWPGLFTERCLYSVTTAENERDELSAGLIWANSRAMLADRITALRHANVYERQRYRHILGLPFLLGQGSGKAACETPFVVYRVMHGGETVVFATGVYKDVFDLGGEQLQLERRIVVLDSSRVDTLLAIPL